MKFIIPLIKLSRKQFGINPATWGPKLRLFFYEIENGNINDRKQAAKLLYNSSPTTSAFKSLESSARTKLIDSILIHKPIGTNDSRKKIIMITKVHAVIHILKYLSLSSLAGYISEWIISYSIKYQNTRVTLDLADILEGHYLKVNTNLKMADYYRDMSNKYLFYYQVEREVRKTYNRVYLPFKTKKSISTEEITKVLEQIRNIQKYYGQVKTLYYMKHYFVLSTWEYQIKREYHKALKLCDEIEEYLNSLSFKSVHSLFIVYNSKIYNLLALRNYQDAYKTLKESEGFYEHREYNWCRNRMHGMSIALNLDKVDLAIKFYNQGARETQIHLYGDEMKNTYILYHIYIQLWQGKTVKVDEFAQIKSYYRDKSGMSVALRVAILWNNALIDITSIYDHIESTEKYIRRSLKKNQIRSRSMLELLLQLPIQKFDFDLFSKNTKKLFSKLSSISPEQSEEPEEVEIVCFENLWKQILKTTNSRRARNLYSDYEIEKRDYNMAI